WEHDKLAVFGLGAGVDEPTWRGVFRQLVALGYARPDHDAFGGLVLTEAARPVLKGEARVEMRRPAVSRKRSKSRGKVDTADPVLQRLKAWRSEQARAQSVPPYVVFHDATLAAIAAAQPRNLDALSGIAGIGAKKLERYGPALLEILAS
ncbi:MAG TPA: HRDC domain-containing protein, partial [Burkholderiales bacterium]|nr:HRDC domain-containing protein [Burkholderiales bacterium]